MFTSPLQRLLLANWEKAAQGLLAQFRAWWPQQALQATHTEKKELHHPLVGRLVHQPTTFQVTDAPDLRMVIYTPLVEANTAQKLAQLVEPMEIQMAE
jgi:MmyB-like transcription regulator ligand binding domain